MSSQTTDMRPLAADRVVARFGDPGLAGQLLRIANSSLFGMGGRHHLGAGRNLVEITP